MHGQMFEISSSKKENPISLLHDREMLLIEVVKDKRRLEHQLDTAHDMLKEMLPRTEHDKLVLVTEKLLQARENEIISLKCQYAKVSQRHGTHWFCCPYFTFLFSSTQDIAQLQSRLCVLSVRSAFGYYESLQSPSIYLVAC